MSFTKTSILLLLGATLGLSSCSSDPDAARLSSEARPLDGDAQRLYNGSYAAEQAGKASSAIKGYQKINRVYPMSPVAPEAQYRVSRLLQREGELLKAFDSYNDFLKNFPASPHYADAMRQQEIIAHGVADGQIKNSFLGWKSRINSKRAAEMLAKVRDNAPRSASAEKAQFTIGSVYKSRKNPQKAIEAFRALTRDYPLSKYAPEAQYQIGALLLEEAKGGNQDAANLDRARNAFEDLLIRHPKSKRAADAKRQIAKLSSGDIQRSYDIAEFYRKKGQTKSALHYYSEVLRTSKPGPLRSKAQAKISELKGQ